MGKIDFTLATIDFNIILPEIILLVTAFVILLSGLSRKFSRMASTIAVLGLLISLYYSFLQWGNQQSGFWGMVHCDYFGVAFKIIFILVAMLSIFTAHRFLIVKNIARFEYYALILISTMGMMVMANTTNLVVIFLGLEIMSVPLYVMAGFARRSLASNESGIKYFIMGAFASGFLLLGISFIYGATGFTDLRTIHSLPQGDFITYLLVGIALVAVGFGFKIGAVPFHSWVPDVYHGAPTPVTAFFSVAAKAAGFAALMRLFFYGFQNVEYMTTLFWILSALTMTVGNIFALRQDNVKRLLAYSSIAHAGYILVAFTVGSQEAMSSGIFYLIAYGFFNLGAFTILIMLESRSKAKTELSEMAGLAKTHPYLSAVLALFMFALAGFPPTVGFVGKFYIFSEAVKNGFIWLTIIGVMNSFISVYYYLRVIKVSYFDESTDFKRVKFEPAVVLVLIITALGTIGLGMFPNQIISFARQAIFGFI